MTHEIQPDDMWEGLSLNCAEFLTPDIIPAPLETIVMSKNSEVEGNEQTKIATSASGHEKDNTVEEEDVVDGSSSASITDIEEEVIDEGSTVRIVVVEGGIVDGASTASKNNNPPKIFECSKCEKKFARYRCAQAHCKNIFSWTCENCGEKIKQRNNVKRHKTRCEKKLRLANAVNGKGGIVADGEENTSCRLCGKNYKNGASLKTHVNLQHKEDRVGDFKCDQCDFVTKVESCLKKHMTMKHTHKVKFNCSKCDYFCFSPSGLKKHRLAVHRGPPPVITETEASFDNDLVKGATGQGVDGLGGSITAEISYVMIDSDNHETIVNYDQSDVSSGVSSHIVPIVPV